MKRHRGISRVWVWNCGAIDSRTESLVLSDTEKGPSDCWAQPLLKNYGSTRSVSSWLVPIDWVLLVGRTIMEQLEYVGCGFLDSQKRPILNF